VDNAVKLLDKLEKRLGRFAIRNLMTYIVGFNALVYILTYLDTTNMFLSKLVLIPSHVLRGEIWRLITYVFIPPQTSPLWIVFALYFYYLVGNALENEWGSFKFNAYYLIGMLCTTIAVFSTGGIATAIYLNTSLFLAFARIYPDFTLMLFFILPVKVKYLAWLEWFFLIYTIATMPLSLSAAAIAAIINYFVFFGKDIITRTKTGSQVRYNRIRFNANLPKDFTMHKCTVCGKTEKDDPKAEFRYCVDCEGDYEYCMDHLYNHQHVKKESDDSGEHEVL
jgi:membrane associated rhomboid family serine protease